jgi:hypothetical protein
MPAQYKQELGDNPVSICCDVNQFNLNRALSAHSDYSSLLWYGV